MISDNILRLLNEQINKEFYSAYLYLSMAAYFNKIGLFGFANWTGVQAKEEVDHGMIIFDYIIDRRGTVELVKLDTPDSDFRNALETFEKAFAHEQTVTASIYNIARIADEEGDMATKLLMNWFIKEQVEEEEHVHSKIERIKLFGDNCTSLYLMDKEMSERIYQAQLYT